MSHKNQYSISPIAAAVSTALVTPAAALAQEEGARDDALENIIVTARKRDEDVQRIPSTVQAIPESMLKEMGALNTEDYARFIPSMNWVNLSTAGAGTVIFRGVNTGLGNFIATSSSSVYFDEIPVTSTNGRSPDLRMMDVNRVEALAGPQGTLFGAAAQAGTLRVITNQPDPSQFEASGDVMVRSGEDSDESYSITGVLNIPLVEDVFAIRIAAQTAEDGGFIDNVLGHTPDGHFGFTKNVPPTNPVWPYDIWDQRQEWGDIDNADVAEENWNSVEFIAARISARWNINDNWSATASYGYYETEAQAGNDYNPFVGDLQTIQHARNLRRDKWDLASLTIDADLGFAQFVSATSFFDRTYDYSQDATMYYKYWMRWMCEDKGASPTGYFDNPDTGRGVYYQTFCVGPTSSADPTDLTQQADFVGLVEGPSWQDRFTQEFRLSHQGETFDWLAGLYYEDSNDNWDTIWMMDRDGGYQNTDSIRAMEAFYSDPANCNYPAGSGPCQAFAPGTTFPDADFPWYARDRTNWEQKAVFGELTWHINDEWHATIGGRWFETTNDKSYIKYHAGHRGSNGLLTGGVFQQDWAPGSEGGEIAHGSISEFVPKFNVSWYVSDDKMMYGSYTEGFRTGGTNRNASRVDWAVTVFPQTWEPDKLKNYEIGAKTRWADNSVQLNVALFRMDWEDFQTEVVDPSGFPCDPVTNPAPNCGNPWLKVVGNSGDAHSDGVTAELAWVPADGWDVGANAQWLEAEIDEPPPQAATGIEAGQRLPNVPDFQGSVWAAYTWPVQFIQGGEMFLRGQFSYQGDSVTKLVPADETAADPQFTNASYSVADVRLGLISIDGGWRLEAFVNNIGDERAQNYQGGKLEWQWSRSGEYDHFHRVYTNRPREYGLRFAKTWGD